MRNIKKIKNSFIKSNSCSSINENSSFDLKRRIKLFHPKYFNKTNEEITQKKSIENYSSLPRTNSSFIPKLIKTHNSSNIQNSTTLTKIKSNSLLNITQDNNINNNFNKTAFFKQSNEKISNIKTNFRKFASTFWNYKNTISHKKLEEKNSFLKKSKQRSISANYIYEYYLKQSNLEKNRPTKDDFAEYLKTNDSKFNYSLKKIYSVPESYTKLIDELKKNNAVAYKKDFDIQEYQSTLIKLLRRRVSDKFLENLENQFSLFNEKNFGVIYFRGRYVKLANKLKDHITWSNREKIKMLDKGYRKYIKHQNYMKKNVKEDNETEE